MEDVKEERKLCGSVDFRLKRRGNVEGEKCHDNPLVFPSFSSILQLVVFFFQFSQGGNKCLKNKRKVWNNKVIIAGNFRWKSYK